MFWGRLRPHLFGILLIGMGGFAFPAASGPSQDPTSTPPRAPDAAQARQTTPVQPPLSSKKGKAASQRLKPDGEESSYEKWLDQDVIYIITPEERAAFAQLSNDQERDQFVEAFWQRRDPTPDTVENEYKEEHYRRIAYANEHFGAGIPGWKTDRGRIYIIHGAPDQIESQASGGTYERSPQEGGGTTSTFPFERWRYRYVEGVGQEVVVEFVDACMCGDYHMTMDPNEKDALVHTPRGRPPSPPLGDASREFETLQRFVGMNQPPKIRFKDLNELVTHKISPNLLPFDQLVSFVRVTGNTVLVLVALQIKNRDITFANTNNVARGTLNILGRFTTLSGRVAQTFEDTVQVDMPAELLPRLADNASVYGKALPLQPGHYRLDLVVKDVNGDRVGSWAHSVAVPEYTEDRLATSSLIVADRMEPVPTPNIGSGSFVIGDTYLRPRLPSADGRPARFKVDQKIAFWMQAYNLTADEKTHKPSAIFDYDIVSASTGQSVIHSQQSTSEMGNVGDQITLQKTLPARDLKPGVYMLRVKVNDNLSRQTAESSATFAVE